MWKPIVEMWKDERETPGPAPLGALDRTGSAHDGARGVQGAPPPLGRRRRALAQEHRLSPVLRLRPYHRLLVLGRGPDPTACRRESPTSAPGRTSRLLMAGGCVDESPADRPPDFSF